ncbi:hypothetical protein [Streptomyces sp. NPDC002580]|uniref:hypothetical protein n=1 Tax=Streptomyces sp. NPDC002580 TaxID=3364653 RepID=UPI0036A76F8E
MTAAEDDLRALDRLRRAVRLGAESVPSLSVKRRADGSADIEHVAGSGDCRGTLDRTVAVLTLPPDEDVAILVDALAPGGTARDHGSTRDGGSVVPPSGRPGQGATLALNP